MNRKKLLRLQVFGATIRITFVISNGRMANLSLIF